MTANRRYVFSRNGSKPLAESHTPAVAIANRKSLALTNHPP